MNYDNKKYAYGSPPNQRSRPETVPMDYNSVPQWQSYNPPGPVPRIPQHNPEEFQDNKYIRPQNYNQMEYREGPYGSPPAANEGMAYPGVSPYLGDPMANVAMHYGAKIVGSSRTMVDKEIGKYVAMSRLKYYFAVDTNYVLGKLKLLLFPFTHTDWSTKFDQNEPLQPRYDVNAPDLYIPCMAYVTYVLVAGLVLGTQNRFSPEMLGILASQAMAWTVVEIMIQLVTIYVTNIDSNLKTLDLLAFSGYKFVGIVLSVLVSILFQKKGYYISFFYTSVCLAYFLVRSLKFLMLAERNPENLDHGPNLYSSPVKSVYSTGNKRRMYFMISIAVCQPILMWWLSYHLVSFPV